MSKLLVVLLLLLTCAGCIKVGPNFHPPVTSVQEEWLDERKIVVDQKAIHITSWWHNFRDETLNEMVCFAMRQNYSLQEAAYRIKAARANLCVAIGEQYPQTFQLEGEAIRTHISANAPNTRGTDRDFWDFLIGHRMIWEIDFWGRFARGVEEAYGEFMAAKDNYLDIKRLVISDIVLDYIQLKTTLQRLDILESNAAIQRRSTEIAEIRFETGYESELDYDQAGALWKRTEAQMENLKIEVKRFATSIAILLGLTPEAFTDLFFIDSSSMHVPQVAAIGFPAEILVSRPDLRRLLDELFAQNARVGIAVSDLYPRISFTGFLGLETSTASTRAGGSSLTYFFGPSFVWPIFSFGRIENRIREQIALLNAGIALYRNQVLIAFKEVEDALTFYAQSMEETADLDASFRFAKRAVDISILQYQEGIADFTRVLNSEQQRVEAEDRLTIAQGNIALAYATIYRSLGLFCQ